MNPRRGFLLLLSVLSRAMKQISSGFSSRLGGALLFLAAGAAVCSAQIDHTVGTLAPGQSVTFTYDVTINEALSPATTTQVSHQATLSYNGGASVVTDDPETSADGDPTVTPLTITATKLVVTAPAGATAGSAVSVSVTAYDDFDNVATGYTGPISFTSSDAVATLPAAGATLTNGTGTFSVTFKTAGDRTVSATDIANNAITGTSATVTVGAGAATHFVVTAPASTVAGVATTVTVTAQDDYWNTATGYAGTVTFTSNDAAATLPANAMLTNGTGSFSVTFTTVGTRGVTATDTVSSSISGISNNVAVSPAAATHFVVSAPASSTAGQTATVTVTARDAFNNIATGYGGTVQLSSSDASATLAVPATLTNGTDSFTVIFKTAGSQTVTATDADVSSINGVSGNVVVSAAAATHFVVSAPVSATAGATVNVTITARDEFSNTAVAYAGTVRFASTDLAATLPANSTLTNGSGTFGATFRTAGTRTVTATDTVASSISGASGDIDVSAAATTHFTVTAPGSASAGESVTASVVARDAFDNVTLGYAGTVHFTSSDSAAALPADAALTGGTGTFDVLFKTVGDQSITATDTVNASITGTSAPVSVGAAAALRFRVTAPASATAGQAVNVSVTALDAFDNVATAYAGTVHFTSSDAAAVLPADATLTSGAGTFSVTLKSAGTADVTATDTALATITGTSADVAVSPAAAASFRVSVPSTTPAGSAVNVTVTALDAFDNTDTAYAGSVSITSSDTLASLPAAAVLTNGTGTFSVTLFTAGDQTVTATGPHATSGSITGTSATIAVTALDATVTLADLEHIYDGTAKTASATTTPADLLVTFSYDGVPLPLTTSGDLSAYASAINRTLAVRVTGRASGTVVGNGIYAITSDLATAAVHAGALAVDETKVLSIAILADVGTYAPSTQNGVTSQAGGAATASFAILGEASGTYATSAPVDAGSYAVTATIVDPSYTGSATGTLVISPAGLTITGVVANNKTYDTTTLATLNLTAAALVGVIGSDDVALDSAGATAAFASADAGTGKPVTASSFALSGTSAGNYTLAQPTGLAADILKATAIVTLGDLNHSYDGTAKSASVSTTPTGLTTTVTYAGSAAAPSAIGTYEVVATVSDLNYTGSTTGTLTIVNSQPVITQQPQDQLVANGGTVTLSVSVSSQTAVTYQWYFEGEPLSGATSSTLTLNAIRRSQAGDYTVVVTNSAGSVTSSVATVTVEAVAYTGTYFGQISDSAASSVGEFALLVRDTGAAVLLAYLPATQAGYFVNATVNEDGEFAGTSTQLASLEAGPVFRGRIIDGVLTGAVDGLTLTFAADVSPATNWATAGYYETVGIGTVPLTTYLIIGTDSEVLAVTITGAGADGATGTLTENSSFNLTTPDGLQVSGSIDTANGQIAGTVTMPDGTAVPIGGVIDTVPAVRRMANASGRAHVGTGDNVLIAGFVLQGTEPKTVLIRAAGPALGSYGVGATLARPQLTLYHGGDALATNAGWSTAANAAQIEEAATTIGAFGFPAGSVDSAILTTLQPGAYTAAVRGADGGSGVSLVEVYDVSGNPTRIVNLSTRGYVGQGEQVLIAGVIVTGNTPKKLLIRAVGPTLGGFGVAGTLADPRLRIYDDSTVIAQNDNWSGNAQVEAATAATGAFTLPADSKDAAIVITLAPGAYTVLVDGVNGAAGVALVESYELP